MMTFIQSTISPEGMEVERQRIAAITPFSAAQTEAIKVVRGWTRTFMQTAASERGIIDLQDPILNSPAEQSVIDAIRTSFGAFQTAANAATTLSELNTAWQTYQTDITSI